jgi:hypothetical protein
MDIRTCVDINMPPHWTSGQGGVRKEPSSADLGFDLVVQVEDEALGLLHVVQPHVLLDFDDLSKDVKAERLVLRGRRAAAASGRTA